MDHDPKLNPSLQIVEMIIARFLCKRNNDLTWIISPKAERFARSRGVPISTALLLTPTNDWLSYKDLRNHEKLIHDRHEYFEDVMRQLVVDIPAEIDRFVTHIRPDEYRILLTYAGQEVYEFFARDHRFGAPPRGKVYRSNKRKTWTTERSGVRRPDMAVVALERKIRYVEALGGDTDLLKIELQRRKDAIARGEDPMAGQRRHTLKKVQAPTPRQALDLMRASVFGRPTERKNFGRRWDD